MALQHLRSSTASKRPTPAAMSDGQLAINTNTASPGLFFKDSAGALIKVGPVHVGTTAPNASPASGGETGNTVGEQWLDTTGGGYVFKVWDGSAWRSETGEFVNVNGDTMTGDLVMNNANIVFEGATADDFETTLTVTDPTADRTITLPDQSGNVLVSGNASIVDADVNASAAIAGTKIDPDFGSQTVETTGVFSAAAGAEATPSITFTGDLNTGIYSPGADQVAISTNGTGRLFVDSNGSVGVGTSSPNFVVGSGIEIERDSASATLRLQRINTGASALEIRADDAKAVIDSRIANTDLAFQTTGAERLRVTAAGLVGIGITSPASILHVNQDVSSGNYQSRITLENTDQRTVIGSYFRAGVGQYSVIQSTNEAESVSSALLLNPSGGNVGVGTTNPTKLLQVSDSAATSTTAQANTIARLVANASNADAHVQISNGVDHSANIGIAGGANLYFALDGLERARIDSSGRLLVGTLTNTGNYLLQTEGRVGDTSAEGGLLLRRGLVDASIGNGNGLGSIDFAGQSGGVGAQIRGVGDAQWGTNDYPGRLVFSTTADGASSPTERMRISQSGQQFNVSTADGNIISTTQGAGTTYALFVGKHSGTAGSANSGTASIYIYSNGNVQNTNNSYGAISDIKLKENIVDANTQWDDIKALQVRNYNFKKGETHTQLGLIAQEVELVSPGLVSESPDRDEDGNDLGTVTKSVNYSVLYMKAVKALQEAMERIETLEAKVAALESM